MDTEEGFQNVTIVTTNSLEQFSASVKCASRSILHDGTTMENVTECGSTADRHELKSVGVPSCFTETAAIGKCQVYHPSAIPYLGVCQVKTGIIPNFGNGQFTKIETKIQFQVLPMPKMKNEI